MDDIDQFDDLDDDSVLILDEETKGALAQLREQTASTPPNLPENAPRLNRAKFVLQPDTLKTLTLVTNVRPNAQKPQNVLVGVEVSGNQIRLTASRRWLACRAAGPLGAGEFIEGSCAFSLPYYQLRHLGRHSREALLCTIDLEEHVLNIRDSKGLSLNLSVSEFPNYDFSSELFDLQKDAVKVRPDLLREALAFVSPTLRIEKNHPDWAVVQIGNGRCFGGHRLALAIFEAPGLAGLELRARSQVVRMMRSILLRFKGLSRMTRGEKHQLISDGLIDCIFDFPPSGLPDTNTIANMPASDRYVVDASPFVRALFNLSVVRTEQPESSLLTLERGGELGAKLKLSVESARGMGETTLETHQPEVATSDVPGSAISVPLDELLRAVPRPGLLDASRVLELAILRDGDLLMVTYRYDDTCGRLVFLAVAQGRPV